MRAFASLLSPCLATVLAAQTFVVDAANGPGTHFTDLPTATATVPDGAVLLVRAGAYAAFTISGKGMSLLFAPGATLAGLPLVSTVTGTSVAQTVLLRGLRSDLATLQLTSCQGPVLLQDCTATTYYSRRLHLVVDGCGRVHADGCTFGGSSGTGVRATNSTCVFRGCSILGYSAMALTGGSTQLVDSNVDAVNGFPTGAAIAMANADARLVGGQCTTVLSTCIDGTGVLRLDPSVAFPQPVFGPHVAPSLQTTIAPMPAVVANSAPLGSTVTASMRGPAGDLGVLFAGSVGAPWYAPGVGDPFWTQPGSEVICAIAVLGTTPVSASYLLPNVPAFAGTRFCWQSVSLGAAGLQASNPAVTSHW